MIEVNWSIEAIVALDQIVNHIEQDNPLAAARVRRNLHKAGESLQMFPNRGRLTQNGERELVTVWPYIITYVVEREDVTILSIRHGAQLPRSAS